MASISYCVWGLCESWEYCCGDNTCCREKDLNPLLLTLVILGTLILVALFCVCIFCNPQRVYAPLLKKYFRISYTLISKPRESKATVSISEDTTKESYVVEVETAKISS